MERPPKLQGRNSMICWLCCESSLASRSARASSRASQNIHVVAALGEATF